MFLFTWQALLPVALQLHVLYQPSPLLPTASCRPHRHPWGMLMGSVLLAGETVGDERSTFPTARVVLCCIPKASSLA